LAVAASLLISSIAAIYLDDHWSYSTQLTEENFQSTVQTEIEAGRTLFVRWIASPHFVEFVTKAFEGNKDVTFGDVNLMESPIKGQPHNPGQGGWPTIRYFSKDTGYRSRRRIVHPADIRCHVHRTGKFGFHGRIY
jgi:hypothetical protein